jgi:competence protein ComEA
MKTKTIFIIGGAGAAGVMAAVLLSMSGSGGRTATLPVIVAPESVLESSGDPYDDGNLWDDDHSQIEARTAPPTFQEILSSITEPAVKTPFDLNAATSEELQSIKGIGPVTAKSIIEYRDLNGPFESVDELLNVKGIGEKKLEEIKNSVYVE